MRKSIWAKMGEGSMSEKEFETFLYSSVELYGMNGDAECGILAARSGVKTFEDAGVMTYNKGLVIRMDDGSEFQVTIVKSK